MRRLINTRIVLIASASLTMLGISAAQAQHQQRDKCTENTYWACQRYSAEWGYSSPSACIQALLPDCSTGTGGGGGGGDFDVNFPECVGRTCR